MGLSGNRAKVPLPILLFLIFAILVPIEFSLYIGPLFMTASRTYLVVLTFMLLPHLGQLKLRLFDWFFIGHVAWSIMALVKIYGVGGSVEKSGSYFLEFLVVYLAARIYLQTLEQIRATIGTIFVMVVVSAAFAFPEAFTGIRFVHEFASGITGIPTKFSPEMRMGITRAASFFEHPILYGVFCASSFSLIWFISTPAQRYYRMPIIIFATWLSASSAPLLTLLVQIGLLLIEPFTRKFKRRDKVLGWLVAGFAAFMQIFTGRGVVGLVMLITINPSTAYTRRAQWNFAIDDVMRNPWFGFRPETYTRPFWLAPSIDNWWLLIMMRTGIPSLILMALCALFLWIAIARREGPPLFNQLRTGWGMAMIAIILGAATVTFFGKLQPLFAFYMGMGAALATCALPAAGTDAPAPPAGRRGPVYTRFASTNRAQARVTRRPAETGPSFRRKR
jgi:hypothetical protein